MKAVAAALAALILLPQAVMAQAADKAVPAATQASPGLQGVQATMATKPPHPTQSNQPAQPTQTINTVPDVGGGLIRSVFGLGVVLALIMGCAWLAKRFGNRVGRGKTQLLKTVGALPLGQRESVVVVELGDQWLVLGVAPGRVSALAQMPRQVLPEAERPAAMNAFAQLLARSRPETHPDSNELSR
jgi:flagellar protein FliO/FliZ